MRYSPEDKDGDILIFLPGAREIRDVLDVLRPLSARSEVDLFALHGSLSLDEQVRAITSNPKRRRIIASTNIAETSLTVEGVTSVIDSGWVKLMTVDPASGLDRLETRRIAKDSATQRAGRAGRVRPGRAIRMWSEVDHGFLDDVTSPEIMRADLSGPLLEVMGWSGADPGLFDWFERPPEVALSQAMELLVRLGAVTPNAATLTPIGRALWGMPAHPRQGTHAPDWRGDGECT